MDFPPRLPEFDPRPSYMGILMDNVALWRVFSEYFGILCQLSLYLLLHIH
jgi:hypothetical protein